ncbi:MMPL family transporter [Nocardia implantans]|uniref:MMPL family transporter n=1 Tax=Nocardia implantans TaxID=3108168 RepID=A0ABU6AMQ8_9NOCA|nr:MULTISPECIES: MMPL family transporter [unclassified Nocardia]MBF6193532.1 MMPL family transporter [Nocardia beijingensis]MEA3532140.1 MMPL family transporter [Nocardia sp. CDC192]MEB3508631.1 MMPL family transporter [Nocardia sp. CDC186]
MFTRWGDLVYRLRFAVIGVVVAGLLALGGYGLGLEDHLSSSGWDDPTSESARAARIKDGAFARDHTSDVIVLYTAPEGKTIDDPEFSDKILENLTSLPREHPDEITQINGVYWRNTANIPVQASVFGSKDKKYAFASIAIKGDNDTEMVRNYRKVKNVFFIPGVDVQVTGLQAVAGTLNDTMADDQKRMEILAIPAVAVLLFFIFGGIVAAGLPLIVGGLTVIGAWGIVRFITEFTEVNSFVSPVVSMIGLGLAIDYGLFIVSRFREELAEGYDTRVAVRRSVMTAGRTVVFSATMIVASLGGMLLFPQGFLKSVAYGAIATVSLAALTSITVLPAMLAVLGKRVDMLGLKRFRKTKTADEVEGGFWGQSTRWVMKHPLKIAIPLCIILLLLIIPVKNLSFGGINERYLPPDNPTRLAQKEFDTIFPLRKSDPIELVFVVDDPSLATQVGKVVKEASKAPGLAGEFAYPPSTAPNDKTIYKTSVTLTNSEDADPTIDYLRSLELPDGVTMLVGGQPAIQKDSISALLGRMPLMIALVLFVTTLLMFLTFGSLVLPIKAALMSALGLGSTLGILTWIFIDGHGAGLLNFTPQPIMSPVLVLIIAIIYGLSTDYEVFLMSRMVEARAQGASTTEAVRIGTAQTGRIITAAALILLVVTGAFAFSDLVMMQYIAYGMIAALFIDATVLRMLLVPATMKLLGDDCWWAPTWMKKVQEKVGLGEPILDDERVGGGDVVDLVKTTPITDPVTMQIPAVAAANKVPRRRKPRTVAEIEAEAPTRRLDRVPPSPAPQPTPAPPPLDPGRQRPEPPRNPTPPQGEPIRPRRISQVPNDPRSTPGQAEQRPPSPPANPQGPAGSRPLPPTGLPHDPSASHAGVPSVILPERSPRPAVSPITPPAPRPTPAPEPRPLSGITQDPTLDLAQHEPSGPRPARLPSEDSAVSDGPAHRAPEPEAPAEPYNGPDTTNRSSIESWMAELRSSRRHIGRVPEEGRHHGGDGRTVSVNELLRRRERE